MSTGASYMKIKSVTLLAVLFVIFELTAGIAKASTYELKNIFNGDKFDTGSNWLTADFQDTGTNMVMLTLTSHLLDPDYFIQKVAFNISPFIMPSSLLFSTASISGTTLTPSHILNGKDNACNLAGSGSQGKGFDVLLNFPNANKNRFNNNDSITLIITGLGITADSFDFLNASGAANVGAHIALGGSRSSAVTNVNPSPVPIPGSVWILGSALLGMLGIRRKVVK
jgi:hypothetical protein